MGRPSRLLALAAAVLLLGFVLNSRGEDTVSELIKINDQRAEAEVKRDVGYLDRLLADDLEGLNSRGELLTKQQLLDHTRNPEIIFTELRSENVKVRVYGNVAVMTDHTISRGIEHGRDFGGVSRFVRIFVKENGRWRAVLAQATPLKVDSGK